MMKLDKMTRQGDADLRREVKRMVIAIWHDILG